MTFDLSKENELHIFYNQVQYLIDNKKLCEIEEIKKTRSNLQNAALHKYFEIISNQLNEMGITFNYQGITGKELELNYTPSLVKEMIWRPIQKALFEKESTTQLTTQEINQIIDILTKFFSERGVYIAFPSIHSLLNEEL